MPTRLAAHSTGGLDKHWLPAGRSIARAATKVAGRQQPKAEMLDTVRRAEPLRAPNPTPWRIRSSSQGAPKQSSSSARNRNASPLLQWLKEADMRVLLALCVLVTLVEFARGQVDDCQFVED